MKNKLRLLLGSSALLILGSMPWWSSLLSLGEGSLETAQPVEEMYGYDRLNPNEDTESEPSTAILLEQASSRQHILDTIVFERYLSLNENSVLLQNPGHLLPLHANQPLQFRTLSGASGEWMSEYLTAQFVTVTTPDNWDAPMGQSDLCDKQTVMVWHLSSDDLFNTTLQERLWQAALAQPTVVVLSGQVDADVLAAYPVAVLQIPDNSRAAQALAAEMLAGAADLPLYQGGFLSATRLGHAPPEAQGVDRTKLEQVDYYVNRAIRKKAMPGGQVLVAKGGKIIYEKAFGHHTYNRKDTVQLHHLYDLASITKAIGTTIGIMDLVEQERIQLDVRLQDYLPNLYKSPVRYLKVDHLLAHHTGLQPNLPMVRFIRDKAVFANSPSVDYTRAISKDAYLRNGVAEELLAQIERVQIPKRPYYSYSDINFILLQQLLEHKTGLPLDKYLDKTFYAPMGLQHLGYRPELHVDASNIAPTEKDGFWRKRLVHGEVHDECAALMGGVAGHAGLFGNAADVAAVFQMLLNKGSYAGQRYLRPSTVEQFIEKNPYNNRAYGFDRLAIHSGNLRSLGADPATFGHTGFSGVSAWADPANDLIIVFLSNRIHPNEDNILLQQLGVRERIQQVIYQSLNSYREDA